MNEIKKYSIALVISIVWPLSINAQCTFRIISLKGASFTNQNQTIYGPYVDENECNRNRNYVLSNLNFSIGSHQVSATASPCSCAGSNSSGNTSFSSNKGTSFFSANKANEIKDWSEDEAIRRMGLDKNDQSIHELEISMGNEEADKVRENMRKNASLIPPLNAFQDETVIPYTDEISMAQSRIMELTGMDAPELHENIILTESFITADYNQRILELNKQMIINEMQLDYAWINALCNKNMPESERKKYESKLNEMESILINEYNVSKAEIESIQNDAKSWVTETAKLLDDDRELPQGYDLNKITELFASLADNVSLKYCADMQKQMETDKNAITTHYNNNINMLRAVDDLLKIKKGVDSDGTVSYGSITPERANNVMSWFGSHGRDVSSLFPEKFIQMHMNKDTKIEIK